MKPRHKSISAFCILFLFSVGLILPSNPAGAQPFVYVSDGDPLGSGNSFKVVDTGTNTVVAVVTLGSNTKGSAVTPDGTRVYVPHSGGVSVLDTGTNTVVAVVAIGNFPGRLAMSPDGTRVYAPYWHPGPPGGPGVGNVVVIDTGTNTVIDTVPFGDATRGVSVTPDGARVYVALYYSKSVSVIETATNTVVATIEIGGPNFPFTVAVTPDGQHVFLNDGTVIETATNTVVTTLAASGFGIAFSSDGSRAYFSHGAIIDTETLQVVGTLSVGGQDIVITPDGSTAYVSVGWSSPNSGLNVVDIATGSVITTVPGLPYPGALAITPSSQTPQEAIQDVTDVLQGIVDGNPNTPIGDKLEDIVAKLQTSLDELNKQPPDNQAALGSIEGAVGDFEAAVNDGLIDFAQGTDLMDQLADAARQFAADALDFAIAQGGDPSEINDAQQALDEGDALKASASFKDAVSKYKDALAKAESASPASKPIVTRGPTTPSTDLMLDPGSLETPRVHDGIYDSAPLQFELYQNLPNPFNPSTTIRYSLSEATQVRLSIYNVLGQEIRVLVNAGQAAGTYNAEWDGHDAFGREVSTGLYLYRLKAGQHVAVNKMVLAK